MNQSYIEVARLLVRMVAAARNQFLADLRLPVLAPAELYAGKLVAALDRSQACRLTY